MDWRIGCCNVRYKPYRLKGRLKLSPWMTEKESSFFEFRLWDEVLGILSAQHDVLSSRSTGMFSGFLNTPLLNSKLTISCYLADEPNQRFKDLPFWNMFKLVVLHLTKLEVILDPSDESNQRD